MKIKTKIQLVFGITMFVLAGILGIVTTVSIYDTITQQIDNSMGSSAKLAADDISNQLINYKSIAESMGYNKKFTNDGNASEKMDLINKYVESYGFTSGNLLDVHGVSIDDGTDFSDRDYVIQALQGKVNISKVTKSKYTNKYGISIAAPLYDSANNINGVVYFRVDNDFLTNILTNITVSDNSYAYIIDADGDVIAHMDEDYIGQMNLLDCGNEGLEALAKDMVAGNEGCGNYIYNGTDLLCGYSSITGANGWSIVIAAPKTDFFMGMYRMINIVIIIVIVSIILAMVVSTFLSGYISKSVIRVKDVLVAIAQGDLSKKVERTKRKDEIGILQNAAASLSVTLSDIIGVSNYALQQIAEYNLVFEKMKSYPGEFNTLAESVNSIQEMLRNLIMSVQQSSSEVASGSRQLENAAEMLSQGTASQAEAIQGIVTDVENITERINSNSKNGTVINQRLVNLDTEIQSSNNQMTELVHAIRDIEEMSADILRIVETIDGIAFQTHILSLNASVEAARAGENGKGFVVVAEEVGKLANLSTESSTQTAELLEACIRAVNIAKEKSECTFQSLKSIVSDSAEISTAFEEISRDTLEQANSSNEIRMKVNKISDVVQSNMATAEETASSTEELSGQAVSLSNLIKQFRVR